MRARICVDASKSAAAAAFVVTMAKGSKEIGGTRLLLRKFSKPKTFSKVQQRFRALCHNLDAQCIKIGVGEEGEMPQLPPFQSAMNCKGPSCEWPAHRKLDHVKLENSNLAVLAGRESFHEEDAVLRER